MEGCGGDYWDYVKDFHSIVKRWMDSGGYGAMRVSLKIGMSNNECFWWG